MRSAMTFPAFWTLRSRRCCTPCLKPSCWFRWWSICSSETSAARSFRQGGNERAAEVSEEQIDHQRNQHEGFKQGVQHLLDRSVQKAGNVIADRIVHGRRERFFLDRLQLLLHPS